MKERVTSPLKKALYIPIILLACIMAAEYFGHMSLVNNLDLGKPEQINAPFLVNLQLWCHNVFLACDLEILLLAAVLCIACTLPYDIVQIDDVREPDDDVEIVETVPEGRVWADEGRVWADEDFDEDENDKDTDKRRLE